MPYLGRMEKSASVRAVDPGRSSQQHKAAAASPAQCAAGDADKVRPGRPVRRRCERERSPFAGEMGACGCGGRRRSGAAVGPEEFGSALNLGPPSAMDFSEEEQGGDAAVAVPCSSPRHGALGWHPATHCDRSLMLNWFAIDALRCTRALTSQPVRRHAGWDPVSSLLSPGLASE